MRLGVAALVAALALAGCGTAESPGASAADVVPADAAAYVELDTTLDSEQWEQVQALLDRFPSRPQLVEELNEQLREEGLEYERDVEPALGDTLAVVWPGGEIRPDRVVLLTQPDDPEKFRALVAKAGESEGKTLVTGEVDGWQAAAEDQATLDAVTGGSGSLADDDAFGAAVEALPDERLGLGWVRGTAIPGENEGDRRLDWIAGAFEARDNGAALSLVARGPLVQGGEAYESTRLGQAPADALLFVSFDAEPSEEQRSQLGRLDAFLGFGVSELVNELRGEGAVWVRPGGGGVEVTAVAGAENAERAAQALERLSARLPLGDMQVGVVEESVVLTTAASPQAALAGGGGSLGDSGDFRSAKEAAGLPDETGGFFYVNVGDAVPLLALAGGSFGVPSDVVDNLRPVRSVVGWAEPEGDVSQFRLFVEIE